MAYGIYNKQNFEKMTLVTVAVVDSWLVGWLTGKLLCLVILQKDLTTLKTQNFTMKNVFLAIAHTACDVVSGI